jgi:hypothetical protein
MGGTPGRIVVSLHASKLPNGHDGSFVDTLLYSHHRAMYHHCESDTSCRITFDFTSKGVSVVQTQADLNYGCGFGQGVFADGYYKRFQREFQRGRPKSRCATRSVLPRLLLGSGIYPVEPDDLLNYFDSIFRSRI